MADQLPLGLSLGKSTQLGSYLFDANPSLAAMLSAQRDGSGEWQLFVSGDQASGKTHLLLAQTREAESQGLRAAYLPLAQHHELDPQMLEGMEQLDFIAIDDIDAIAGNAAWEEALFHLYNRMKDRKAKLLVSAKDAAKNTQIKLPDLRSRLSWGVNVDLKPLNDEQRLIVLTQKAKERGLTLSEDVGNYIITHFSRDLHALVKLLDQLDHDSLAEQRQLTIPFVKPRLSL